MWQVSGLDAFDNKFQACKHWICLRPLSWLVVSLLLRLSSCFLNLGIALMYHFLLGCHPGTSRTESNTVYARVVYSVSYVFSYFCLVAWEFDSPAYWHKQVFMLKICPLSVADVMHSIIREQENRATGVLMCNEFNGHTIKHSELMIHALLPSYKIIYQ